MYLLSDLSGALVRLDSESVEDSMVSTFYRIDITLCSIQLQGQCRISESYLPHASPVVKS